MAGGRKDGAQASSESREDRLKKALKANVARRKAQARARSQKEEKDKEA